MTDVNLPAIVGKSSIMLKEVTDALGIPRDVLASDDEIEFAWTNLPRLIKKIPPALRSEGLVRMCVAVSSGLFDSAINYIWNASIIELRNKVKKFGLNVVEQIINKKFDDASLLDMKDADLLTLCLKLNLITEEGYFYLDQCRDIRNNFSAAHPVVGNIDENELITFISRCGKHALSSTQHPIGVDIQKFIQVLKASKFTVDQRNKWVERLKNTFDAQRDLLFGTLHGVYCDPDSSEESRINSLAISKKFAAEFSPKIKSDLIDKHSEYQAKGDEKRYKASLLFFEKLELLGLLSEADRHHLISNAAKKLLSVHQAFDNFYNEPPFAERLLQLTSQGAIPETVKNELVTTVVTCAVGNRYGISNAAYPFYEKIIVNFSPSEVAFMFTLPGSNTVVGNRIKSYTSCKTNFKDLIKLLDESSIPTKHKAIYKKIIES
jgi:hypothetical protein